MAQDLETLLTRLLAAEINVSIATAPPAHITVSIHDPNGGRDIAKDFMVDAAGRWPEGAIAAWLQETAERLYPERRGAPIPPHPGLM